MVMACASTSTIMFYVLMRFADTANRNMQQACVVIIA